MDHSESKRGNPLPPQQPFLCWGVVKHSFIHTTAFVTPVVDHWLEREIAQWVDHEQTLLPRSYISLPGYIKFMLVSLICNTVWHDNDSDRLIKSNMLLDKLIISYSSRHYWLFFLILIHNYIGSTYMYCRSGSQIHDPKFKKLNFAGYLYLITHSKLPTSIVSTLFSVAVDKTLSTDLRTVAYLEKVHQLFFKSLRNNFCILRVQTFIMDADMLEFNCPTEIFFTSF